MVTAPRKTILSFRRLQQWYIYRWFIWLARYTEIIRVLLTYSQVWHHFQSCNLQNSWGRRYSQEHFVRFHYISHSLVKLDRFHNLLLLRFEIAYCIPSELLAEKLGGVVVKTIEANGAPDSTNFDYRNTIITSKSRTRNSPIEIVYELYWIWIK